MFQEIRRNYGPFSARVNFEEKAQIDSEQLSTLDGEIKYWRYSLWRTEARLKGSEHGESGYPLRGETGGREHLKNMTHFEMRANFKTTSTIERWMDRWINRLYIFLQLLFEHQPTARVKENNYFFPST